MESKKLFEETVHHIKKEIHDMNNFQTVVIGNTEMLLHDTEKMSEEQIRKLEKIY